MAKVTCFGAAGSVTGSNYLVETFRGKQILVDCGLFQGGKQMEKRNWEQWGFDPVKIKTLFLTHAHIDHSGRIPKLVKDGFRGKIITSSPTVELCQVMLPDAAHIQEMDAEWQTRKNNRQGKKGVLPLYTMEDAEKSLRYLTAMDEDTLVDIEPGIRARFRNAGHILGSRILELWVEEPEGETKIVFSGDLGNKDQLIIRDPEGIDDADCIFVESTYGNRMHRDFESSKAELLEAIQYAVSNNEKVIIPAFALERSQEILYLLGEFYRTGSLPDIPIYLDSPLAIKATEIFRKNKAFYDEETMAIVEQGFDPFSMPNLHFTPETKESIAINERAGPAIIISASGMCNAGRIKHHLKHNLWRPGASMVIVGFQAQCSTGRQIVDGAKTVNIFREAVAVRAKVFTIGGFSAHADQAGLLKWVSNFSQSGPKVFVTHGEPTASEALAAKIERKFGLDTYVPVWKETLEILPRTVAQKVEPYNIRAGVMEALASLEKETARLRQEIEQKEVDARLTKIDVNLLRRMKDEIQEIQP